MCIQGRNKLRIVLYLFIAFAIISGCASIRPSVPDHVVYINGNILTMDRNNSVCQAVSVKEDRIDATGSNEEIKRLTTIDTIVVDLKGQTMIPGIVDAHSHFPGSGLALLGADLNSPPIGGIKTIDEAIAALTKKASPSESGKWIIGFGFDDTMISDKRHLTRFDLDRVSSSRPVYVMHITGHFGYVNTCALKMLGITVATPNPEGGVIWKDLATSEPTGVLEENAKNAAQKEAFAFSLFKKLDMVRYAAKDYASHGVTTVQNGFADKGVIEALSLTSRLGINPLRTVVWPDEKAARDIIDGKIKTKGLNYAYFKVGPVKLYADGSIQAYTAYLTKPYLTPYHGDSNYRGYPIHKREELVSLVKFFHEKGMQVAVHTNGDAAIDDLIYAVEQAQAASPRQDPRHICVHCQLARDDQLDAMKRFGITPSYHIVHPYYWGDRHVNIFLGPERAFRIDPEASTQNKGIRFSSHLDTPVVPMDPMMALWCATNRVSSGGTTIGEEERISSMQALRSVTIDAAWQSFLEDSIGSIEKGKFADLAILSDNPINDVSKIRDIKAVETIVGGRIVFKARN